MRFAADLARQVHAFEAGPVARAFEQRGDIEMPLGIVRDHCVGRTVQPDAPGQRAGVDPGQADLALQFQPARECALAAEIGRRGHVFAHDAADRAFDAVAFHIFVVGADIADVRERERDDLPGIAGIGHHFLIAGHRGVEAHFTHRIANCTKPAPPGDMTIGEN